MALKQYKKKHSIYGDIRRQENMANIQQLWTPWPTFRVASGTCTVRLRWNEWIPRRRWNSMEQRSPNRIDQEVKVPTNYSLVGGFKHYFFIFIFHNVWDNPSHWLIFFKLVKTTNQLSNGRESMQTIMCVGGYICYNANNNERSPKSHQNDQITINNHKQYEHV